VKCHVAVIGEKLYEYMDLVAKYEVKKRLGRLGVDEKISSI